MSKTDANTPPQSVGGADSDRLAQCERKLEMETFFVRISANSDEVETYLTMRSPRARRSQIKW